MSAASQFFGGGNGGVEGIPLRVLVVAGGGGSGGFSVNQPSSTTAASPSTGGVTGAGGGGAVHEIKGYPGKRGRTYNVTVGAGGTAGEAIGIGETAYVGGKGQNSVFADPAGHTFTAEGGGGGGVCEYNGGGQQPNAYQNDPNIRFGQDGGSGGAGSVGSPPGQAGQYADVRQGGAGNAYSILSSRYANGGYNDRFSLDTLLKTEYGVYGGFPSSRKAPYPGTGTAPFTHSVSGGAGGKYRGTGVGWDYLAPTSIDNLNNGVAVGGGSELLIGNGYKTDIEGNMKAYGAGRESQTYFQTPNVPAVTHRSPSWPNYEPVPNTGHGAYGVVAHPAQPGTSTYYRWEGPGAVGSSGVVIVQYPSTFNAATTTGTVTDLSSSTPGYRTYKFTTDGTIQLP